MRFYCKKRHLKNKNGLDIPSRRIFSFQRKYLVTFGNHSIFPIFNSVFNISYT